MMMSYLLLRCDDAGRLEEEGVVGLVVVHAGGIVDDPLQVGIVLADVDWRSRYVVAGVATCQHHHHLCRENTGKH